MKKLLLLLLILLLGIVIVAPKLISGQVQQNLTAIVAMIDKNPLYSARLIQTSSDWFTTQASIELTIKLNNQPQHSVETANLAPIIVNLNFSAEHGPIVLSPQPSLAWLLWQVEVTGESLPAEVSFPPNEPFYLIRSTTDLLGWSSFTDSLQAFNLNNPQGSTTASFSGWQGSGSYSQVQFSYQGKAQSFRFNSDQLNLEIKNWSLNMDAQTSLARIFDGLLYNSFAQMHIEQFTMADPLNEQYTSLGNLQLTSTSTLGEDQNQADVELAVNLKTLNSSMLAGQDVQLNLQVKHLTADFIQAYQRLIANKPNVSPDQEQQQIQAFLQQHLLGQLQASPELNISRFSGKLTQGDFSSNIHSKLVNVDALPAPLLERNFWLTHLQADAVFEVDKAVAIYIAKNIIQSRLAENQGDMQLSAGQLEDYAQQQAIAIIDGLAGNVLTETATGYAIEFSLADGQAKLNGDPIPLPVN